jgi:hypothetical protein
MITSAADHRLAQRVADALGRRMSAMTKTRLNRRTTESVRRVLCLEMAVVVFVFSLLFIH